MSPRPIRIRKVSKPPVVSGFKPFGNKNTEKNKSVFLHYEEYEALRLCDYEMLNHHQAAVLMDVSRPTLTRIYSRARQKIAEALVDGKSIIIEGGKIYFDSDWYMCENCGCNFNHPVKTEEIKFCPLCKSNKITNIELGEEYDENYKPRCDDICICPECGYEQPHQPGRPCKNEICPQCNNRMVRKGTPHSRKFNY
ncbi:MAG: DUF134 domain-containing protein [Ignavibacteria bacterium]|nr:DUF134 domain-containing protein [Ignavibacteria bacterium]